MAVDRSASERSSQSGQAGTAARPRRLLDGGIEGNERLTAVTGGVLLVLLAVLGVTIVQIRQLIWLHLFLGLLLVGPVILKMSSTGYRFTRYYMRDAAYRRKGPPATLLRVGIAPVVVLTTTVVFATGVALLAAGPVKRDPWLQIHKVSFIVWLVFTSLHVLAHLPSLAGPLRADWAPSPAAQPGRDGRRLALVGALVAGAVLALLLVPDFAVWQHLRHAGHPQ